MTKEKTQKIKSAIDTIMGDKDYSNYPWLFILGMICISISFKGILKNT